MSPAAQKYFDLWVKLDTMFIAGNGQSKEADDLRDLMDDPWYDMNKEDIAQFEEAVREYEKTHNIKRSA
jgi:hypothetical protein